MTVVIGIQVDEDADTPVVAVWYGGTVARTGWTLIHHSGHDVVFSESTMSFPVIF